MFQDLDKTIESLLIDSNTPPFLHASSVSFVAPDKQYETNTNRQDTEVNVFLYEVVENRELRDPAPIIEKRGDLYARRIPPIRVKCSYLVTTWAKTQNKVADEHQLLGEAFGWLSRFPIIPDMYLSGSLIGQPYPPPTMVAQMDGLKSAGEFWSALGIAPRPYFNLVVTIAMDISHEVTSPAVSTLITGYQQDQEVVTREERIQIGSYVMAGLPPQPIAGAWVRLEDAGGSPIQIAITDANGHFTFTALQQGNYTVRVRAQGFTEVTRNIEVPSVTGDYNVKL